ncbi:unnamed protein product [Heterobilharzia americana]|nr:unnamed protein product [Heterobilharzia americana]
MLSHYNNKNIWVIQTVYLLLFCIQNRGPHGVSDDPSTVLSTGFKSDENTVRSLAHKQSFTQGKKQSSYFCFMFHSQE